MEASHVALSYLLIVPEAIDRTVSSWPQGAASWGGGSRTVTVGGGGPMAPSAGGWLPERLTSSLGRVATRLPGGRWSGQAGTSSSAVRAAFLGCDARRQDQTCLRLFAGAALGWAISSPRRPPLESGLWILVSFQPEARSRTQVGSCASQHILWCSSQIL